MTKLNSKYIIRQAEEEDILAIVEIYNERVLNSVHVFNCIPIKLETKLEWFRDLKAKGYPLIVAVETETEQVIGYSDLAQFNARTGYVLTSEISVFIHPDHQRKGLGRILVNESIRIAHKMRFRCIIAVVVTENEPSIKLLSSLGFKESGVLTQVGFKFKRHLDVTFMEFITGTEPAILKPNPSFTPFPWGNYTYDQPLFVHDNKSKFIK